MLFFKIEKLTRNSSTREKYFFNELSYEFNPEIINSLNELNIYLDFISLIGKDLYPYTISKDLTNEDIFHFNLFKKIFEA